MSYTETCPILLRNILNQKKDFKVFDGFVKVFTFAIYILSL